MAIVAIDTIGYVASKKRAPDPAIEHFVRELRAWVDKNAGGNQSEAARRLRGGVTQGHISAVLGRKRGPGIELLLLMRHFTGKTADELLGFKVDAETESLLRMQETLKLEVARERALARAELEEARGLRAEAKRLLEESREIRDGTTARKKKA